MKDISKAYSIGEYFCEQIKRLNIYHAFGVPGNYIIGLLNCLISNNIQFISSCNELNAGYAADCYARIRGVSCLITTYGVGELSALNAIAGAYAEKIPIIVISGTPSKSDREKLLLKHHTIGSYNIPLNIYSECTVSAELLTSTEYAQEQIDLSIERCLKHSRPVYIGIPFGFEDEKLTNSLNQKYYIPAQKEDKKNLNKVVEKSEKIICKANNPILIVGSEIKCFRLQSLVLSFIDDTNLPFSTMLMSKTIFSEEHNNFIGIYLGASSTKIVKEKIESSDCLICLGTELTDINLDRYSANIKYSNMILATNNKVIIQELCYDNILIGSFIKKLYLSLVSKPFVSKPLTKHSNSDIHNEKYSLTNKKITNQIFFDRLSNLISNNDILISDMGSAIFSARHLHMPGNSKFISQPYYGSIGYSVGAALGASIAVTDKRIFIIVGDGAFQATCQELSSFFKYKLKVVFFLLNNSGYTIERLIHDGSYNDIFPWKYHKLPEILGDGVGYEVRTEKDLEEAIDSSLNLNQTSLIEIHLDKFDCSLDLLSNPEKSHKIGVNYDENKKINYSFQQQKYINQFFFQNF